jgi:hypothetical protein
VGYTTGGDFHPALKKSIYYFDSFASYHIKKKKASIDTVPSQKRIRFEAKNEAGIGRFGRKAGITMFLPLSPGHPMH